MKRTILTLFIAIGFAGLSSAQDNTTISLSDDAAPKIKFEKVEHDFGTIKEGVQATVTFKFKNEGTAPLELTSVQASCGCTTPKWTKGTIAPGEWGEVTAIYNSKGRPGNFTKTITVKHNAEGTTEYLTIRGFVEAAPVEAAPPVQVTPQ